MVAPLSLARQLPAEAPGESWRQRNELTRLRQGRWTRPRRPGAEESAELPRCTK